MSDMTRSRVLTHPALQPAVGSTCWLRGSQGAAVHASSLGVLADVTELHVDPQVHA